MGKGSGIVYDKRMQKRFRVLTIVAAVMIVIGFLSIFLWKPVFGDDSYFKLGIGFSLFLIEVGIPMFIIFLYNFLAASHYLSRLAQSGYEVPLNKDKSGVTLETLPRTEVSSENRYASDSKTAALIAVCAYVFLLICDVFLLLFWYRYESDVLVFFVLFLIAFTFFPIHAFVFYRQSNTERYIDNVDRPDGKRKVRTSLFSAILLIVVATGISLIGLSVANSMTRYVYRSRNSSHDRDMSYFVSHATLEVSSSDLAADGFWSSELASRAPQLSFEPVEGASYYIIYMVDETANSRIVWYVENASETELPAGSPLGVFNEPRPEEGGVHQYSVSVFAVAGEPDDEGLEIDPSRDSSFQPITYYYEVANVSDRHHNPPLYGNVLAYGYLSGNFVL